MEIIQNGKGRENNKICDHFCKKNLIYSKIENFHMVCGNVEYLPKYEFGHLV